MNGDKWTWTTTITALLAVFMVSKNERKDVMLDITPHADGSFDRHYGELVASTPASLLAWMKSAAKVLASGDFSSIEGIDPEHVSNKLKSCVVDKAPTSEKAIIKYLASTSGKAEASNLLRYVREINKSMKYVGRGNQTRTQAKGAKPAAKTETVDASAILAALLKQLQG